MKIRRYEKIYQKSLELNVLDANDVTSLEAFDVSVSAERAAAAVPAAQCFTRTSLIISSSDSSSSSSSSKAEIWKF